jgi:Putative DNA-binding domain
VDDRLADLFSEIESPLDIQSKFVTPRKPETNYIEFKQKRDRRGPDLHEDDKKNMAKALSAFSNAQGGILIWGVRTRPVPGGGGDVAWSLRPISGVKDMAERLRGSLLDILVPQNPGVTIEAIANRLGNGYVKCLIPESENPPHRSMVDREYYARLDGRSIRLEHYMIRDMMSRREHPRLRFTSYTRRADGPSRRIDVEMRLENWGKTVAKYAGWYGSFQNARVVAAQGCRDISASNSGRTTITWDAPLGVVIHPNGIAKTIGHLVLEFVNDGQPISVLTKTYCEGMPTRQSTWILSFPEAGRPGRWQLDLQE